MVIARGSWLEWPAATAGVLDNGNPHWRRRVPTDHSGGARNAVCDETSQISMGFV